MEELDEFGIPIKKTVKSSPAVDEFGIPIKKKDSSTGTVTPKKLVSEPQNGSSGGKGFPKKETKGKIVNYVKPKEDSSFFDYLKENLDTGLANVSKSLYDAPGFIYDAAASITNPVFKALGVSKDKLTSSDKLANDLGFKNIPSEILKEKIKVSNDKINAYATKNGGDAFAALENGNYSGAAKLVAGSTMQSLPIMVAAMASGGQTTALAAIGLSTASTKNAELKESNPEMGLGTRVANATNAGIIEAVTGHLFTGASGAVMKKILTEKGVEQGSKIIGKSLKSTIEKSIEKNPFVGALGEIVEESAVEFGNQLNDMSSGIRTEFDVHAIKNAGLSATGMGGLQTLGVYGAKGYVKAKDYAKLKATNKEVFKLRGEIANGNLSDENKALLTLRADRLEAGNKKLLGTEIEKVKALPAELKTELNALNVEFESLKSKFDDIDDADDIPDNLKPAMKEEIKIQASLNQKRKTEILSQNDGLVVDNDFSKFDGVDPDFDLENGKISSLPLKEQDRLNKLAVEQITGGDKTIEYTKEQVSKTANEIYKNEQTSTTSQTKPQAEVQKPSEAEKVDESNNSQISNPTNSNGLAVETAETPDASQIKESIAEASPVPSVSQVEGVSTVVENPLPSQKETEVASTDKTFKLRDKNKFYHASPSKRNGRLKVSNAPQFGNGVYFSTDKDLVEGEFGGDNTTEVSLRIEKPVYANTKEWNEVESLAIEMADKDYGAKNELTLGEDDTYFRYDKDNLSEVAEIPSKFISEAAKSLGYDAIIDEGSTQYTDEIVVLDESKIIYPEDEAASPTNTPTNGNLPIGADNVGENGITKSETPIAESVPSTVDGGENKGDAEVRNNISNSEKDIDVPLSNKGKQIEPHNEVNTDVETVKKELNLNDVENLIYDEFKDTPKTEEDILKKLEKVNDNLYGKVDAIEKQLLDVEIKIEDNGIEIDKINDAEDMTASKKKKAVAEKEKEFKELQKQEKELQSQKEDAEQFIKDIDEKINDWNPEENISIVNTIVDRVNNRLETRKSIKEGTNLFPEDANIPELIKRHEEYFDSLDEKAQIDILENYENRGQEIDNQGKVQSDPESGKSKNDVPNGQSEQNTGAKEKIDPKEVDNDFKSKSGKKSLLNRAVEGGNSQIITDAIEANGLDYKIENREEAKKRAQEFVDEVGTANALEAVRSNQIKGAEKAFVYSTIVDNLMNEIENATNESDKQELEKIHADLIADLTNEFSQEGTDAGRFISALNDIYNSSTLKYNLSKQIESHKAANKGEISDEVLAKFTEADKRIKELEKLIKEAETKAKVAEDELAVKNVQDDIERKKQLANKNKSGLTPKEQTRKKELKNKFFGRLNDATSMITMLADPDFREYLGLTFKQAKGDLANFSKRIITELGKGAQAHLPQLFDEAQKANVPAKPKIMSEETKRKMYIKRLNNDIKSLDTQIADKKRKVVTKVDKYKNDAEIKELRDTKKLKQDELSKVDPSYAESRKLATDLKLAQKSLDEYQRRIDENDLSVKDKELKIVNAKLEKLRKERDVKRTEYLAKKKKYNDSLKEPLVPPTNEEVADKKFLADVNNKINSLNKKIEDLKNNKQKSTDGKSTVWNEQISELETELKDLREKKKAAKTTLSESVKESGSTIKIGKDGKIKIPAQLFRDYVEAGENDIDVIASKIKKDIAEEFPDADVRDIRDALTGYGKQINPTKDDVSIEIARLKSLGKLISAYEDASNGENPLKSGLKRAKPTQEMRELRKEINRIIKENGLDAVDLEKQWASALDKIKSQLTNQIEDLDKQIANGEKRKVERTATPLDAEATALKEIRDAKKQILDDLVGKPELTEEQLIARAEKSLQTSIDKLQKEIADGNIAYKQKPTTKQSVKLDELRKKRKELVETRDQLREQSGLVEAQRLNVAKKRVRKQIEDLNQRIADKDYSKKVVKPLIDDSELSQLRAEKLRQQEVYDAQKYADELRNRSSFQKWTDAILELWNVPRILKATGELSTVLIQGGILTTSRKLTNPKALGKIMKELFQSLGSAKKATYYESLIKAHPLYPLAEKSKLALTNPDYKSDVREEQYSGDYANLAWDLPFIIASYNKRANQFISKERSTLGDILKKSTKIGTPGNDKLSIRDQWKNANPFVVLERGGTLYMNTLRMEEFVRGCEMLRMEGKNEVDHLQDYKLLANAINSMTGRANLPTVVAPSSKLLAAVFFSARNAVSIVNQVNPVYYLYLHFGSTDKFQLKKTSVANKLAVSNMIRFVAITGAMVLAIKAAAGKDEEDEDIVQIETDPNSSDFMKMKIGDIRFDPWHGMTTMIVLMSRLYYEQVKSTSTGETTKLGEKRNGPQNRSDLLLSWARNKFSPSAAITANYLSTKEEVDDMTGESFRETPFGKKFTEDESLDLTPMYWSAVKEIQKEDPGAMAEFLTVVSVFGWNTSVYKKGEGTTFEDKFLKEQAKRKLKSNLPLEEKVKGKVDNRLTRMESKIKEIEGMKLAQKMKIPYYTSSGEKIDVSDIDFSQSDEGIKSAKTSIEGIKKEYGIKDKE